MRPVLSLVLLPILSASLLAQVPAPASKPASRPTSQPAPVAKARATGDERSLALARRVYDFAGGEKGWSKVDNIVFTFRGNRRLLWDVKGGRVRVEPIRAPRGSEPQVTVYDIRKDKNVFGHPTPADKVSKRAAKPIWINDSYWLLVPLKVLDPGVRLSIDKREEGDQADIERLRLRFEGVGMTPKNEYVLHVESKTGKVTQWDFYRDERSRPRSWKFEGYKKLGPLTLSLSRPPVGRGFAIELSDVLVNAKVKESVWTARTRVLLEELTTRQAKKKEPRKK